jgi:formate hydrogenlyase subunit 3/multisubunit Na+/H+ antiporter MnhD subunit
MRKSGALGIAAIVVPLLVILIAAVWFAARAWVSVEGPPMPKTGYVAMALGVIFSLVVGIGLIALVFYSSRHGYDEQANHGDDTGRGQR